LRPLIDQHLGEIRCRQNPFQFQYIALAGRFGSTLDAAVTLGAGRNQISVRRVQMLHSFLGVPGARIWSLTGLCARSSSKMGISMRARHTVDHLADAFMRNIHQVLMRSTTTGAGFGGKSEPIAYRVNPCVCDRSARGLD